MSVNRPTDVKQKEKDINNKLQLYGIFQGSYPTCPREFSCWCPVTLTLSLLRSLLQRKSTIRKSTVSASNHPFKQLTMNVQNKQIDIALNSVLESRALTN